MGIEELLNGAELIVNQNSPVKELPAKGLKEFCPNNSWLEKKQIEKKLEERFNFINAARIEKSNNISLAVWVPEVCKAKVLKKLGKCWETIGHRQDNEDWLLPEEVLFLVENCELQLILGEICASVEDCYALLLQGECCTLEEYRVYSYLCRSGLRVIRHAPSVTVTPYEQQVNLDLVLQRHKRSPPRTCEINLTDSEENEVTIIDDDISILSDSTENDNENVSKSITKNADLIEVIEIEDDVNPKSVNEEVLDCDDDSSDIICVSSPSYSSVDQCRLWYPTVQKCLLRPLEKIIDLCDDDSPDIACDKLDLIKVSKSKVLSLLPDAEKGVSVLYSPDSRLLPTNVVPKYSEYKVNLNVRSDHFNNSYQRRAMISRTPERIFQNNVPMSLDFVNNPVFRKAKEMQAMAMSMIQTASTLISAMGSQNPNELWNFADGRNQDFTHFRSRYNAYPIYPHQRPYYRFPRRNFRRRFPYERRGGNRYGRITYDNKNWNNFEHPSSTVSCSSSKIKSPIFVLSDDEEITIKADPLPAQLNDGKRKRLDSETDNIKKVKTENNVDSSTTFKDSSSSLDTKDGIVIKEESENRTSGIIEGNNQEQTKDTVNDNDQEQTKDAVKDTNQEETSTSSNYIKIGKEMSITIDDKCRNNSSNDVEPIYVIDDTEIECLENKSNELSTFQGPSTSLQCDGSSMIVGESNKQNFTQENSSTKETILPNNYVEDSLDNGLKIASGVNTLRENSDMDMSKNNSNISSDPELSCVNKESDDGVFKSKVTCWQEYKNIEDCLSVKDGDVEPLIKSEQCISYGNVLASLQIFKEVNMTTSGKKYKIMYDIYLPEASFKKSLKILPNFRVIVAKSSDDLPTPMDLKYLKTEYQDQIPFLFSVVFNETISFYLYDNISLPSIFE